MKLLWQELKNDTVIMRNKVVSMWHELKRDWVRFERWLDKLSNKWF